MSPSPVRGKAVQEKLPKGKLCIWILGGLTILYGFLMLVTAPFNVGIVLVFLVGAALIFVGLVLEKIRPYKWLWISLLGATALLLAFLLFLALYGLTEGSKQHDDTDVVIVLGCGIDGERVTPQLQSRLDTALQYHKEHPDALILVSGGRGEGESISEALAMERYLLSAGVPQEQIVKEEHSTSTYTNLANAKAILDARLGSTYTVTLVTSRYHLFRADRTASLLGIDPHLLGAPTPIPEIPMRYLRECLAVAKSLIFS